MKLERYKGAVVAVIDDTAKFLAGKSIGYFYKLVKVVGSGGKVFSIKPVEKASDIVLGVLNGRGLADSWQRVRGEYKPAQPEKGLPPRRDKPFKKLTKLDKIAVGSFAISNGTRFVTFFGDMWKVLYNDTTGAPRIVKATLAAFNVKVFGTVCKISLKSLGDVTAGVGLIFTVADLFNTFSKSTSEIKDEIDKNPSLSPDQKWKLVNRQMKEERVSRFLKVCDFTGKVGLIIFSGACIGFPPLSFATTAPFILLAFVINGISLGSAIFDSQRKDPDSLTNYLRKSPTYA